MSIIPTSTFLTIGLAATVFTAGVHAQVNRDTPGWFPFTMGPADAPADAAMDMSALNRRNSGRITVQNGHFADGQGRRIRFLGTNVTFSGAFPEKKDAPMIARRMAQLGFNVVRFHHMDARDIWLPGQKGLDPEKLDRLTWFLYQLKQNGVYANINLHVSRTYPQLRTIKDLPRTFRYGKVLDIFYEPFIQLQEQYATDLLGHKNTYTDHRLADDPEVAFVELNNENTLLNLRVGGLADMPGPFRTALRTKWRDWLGKRYTTLDALLRVWNRGTAALGPELLRNADFTKGAEAWTLEGQAAGVCEMKSATTTDGKPSVQVRIMKKGKVSWAYQLHQIGISVQNGQTYTIRFRARATPARKVGVSIRFAKAPWKVVSRHISLRLTPKWQDFTLVTGVDGVVPDMPIRLSFNLGDTPGQAAFAAISLRPGREPVHLPAKALAEIELPASHWPDAATADFRRFLIDTERAYVERMRRFLHEKIGVKALIVDTQGSYGGYAGLVREATLSDYVDNHSYWQHPHFPGKPWDGRNWYIPNTSMVENTTGGTFRRLTLYRVVGKPYSISEYNHPFPNDHSAEMFPMIATYGALQDWDAIYQFSYLNRVDSVHRDRISSYFELCHHAAQLVFAPAAAVAFRAFGVPATSGTVAVTIPKPVIDANLAAGFPGSDTFIPDNRLPLRAFLNRRFAVTFNDTGAQVRLPALPKTPGDDPLMSGGPIAWTAAPAAQAAYLVTSPAVRMAVGRIGGRTLELGDVRLTVRLPKGTWACAALAALDARPVAESTRLLFTIAMHVENSDMQWEPGRKSILNHWGSGPIVAQGVSAELVGPGAKPARVFALDARGVRSRPVTVDAMGTSWRLTVGPEFKTLWYSIER